MSQIDLLHIQRFRGITQELEINFPKSKKIHVIFGENGTGKTSIIDAIDYVTNRNLGSIRDKRVSSAGNLPSVNASDPSEIRLVSGTGEWRVTLGKGTPRFQPNNLMGTRILRRSNVQRFIEATASEKFAEIKHLLQIDTIENAESSIRDALKLCKEQMKTEQRSIDDASKILEESWKAAGGAGVDAISWAKTLPADDSSADNESRTRSMRSLLLLQKELGGLITLKQSLEAAQVELAAAHADIAALPTLDQYDAIALGRLLTEAAKVLAGNGITETCPVCEQPITPAHLAEEISKRRASLSQYSQADEKAAKWQNKVRDLQESIQNAEREITSHLRELAGHTDLAAQADGISIASVKNLEQIKTRVNAAIEDLGKQQQSTGRKPLHNALALYSQASRERARLSDASEALEEIEHIMREQRHAFTQETLENVRAECNRIYEAIHPEEQLGFSSLSLDPSSRASLVQTGSFGEKKDINPQALYSEGHLDTLGFAFWLAHSKMDSLSREGKSVIVIDDVFSSVDAEHLHRIVQLLFEEAANFAQIILATHSRVVRDAFLGPRGDANKVNVIELNSFWNLQSGTRLTNVNAAGSALRKATSTENFNRQAAASAAGISLELVLLELSDRFKIKLPYNSRGAYELSILLDRVSSEAKTTTVEDEQLAERSGRAPSEIFTDLKEMKLIRNQVGAHFNAAGLEISDKDVHTFACVALELVEQVSCARCGSVPEVWMGDKFRCRCKSGQRTYLYMK